MPDNDLFRSDDPGAPGAELWLSIAELADAKGKTRQTIHERVEKLERDNLLKTKPGPNRTRLVNVAEYDRVTEETTDFAHQQAAETRSEPASQDEGYSAAARRKMQYEADIKALDLAERRKLVIPVATVIEAQIRIADAEAQIIDRLPLRAAEMAAAVAKDGEAGARALFKTIAFNLRTEIADACKRLEAEGLAEEAAGAIVVDIPIESSA
jgi:DNA-binding transcriptional MocR family regulator